MESFDRLRGAITAIGGELHEASVAGPITEAQLRKIESKMRRGLPGDMRSFVLTTSRRIALSWSLPETLARPSGLLEVSAAWLEFDVARIPDCERARIQWIESCFPDRTTPYDAVWHDKLAFHHVPNGDLLAIDPYGQVVYLSHDDGAGHGVVMAESFTDLLERWLPLGCPGPEDWEWLPFVSGPRSGIEPTSEAGRRWLAFLGLPEGSLSPPGSTARRPGPGRR